MNLAALQSKGFIPGDLESEDRFYHRVKISHELLQQPEKILEIKNFPNSRSIPWHHWDWAKKTISTYFSLMPDWILAVYDKKTLMPWQGGASWIIEKEGNYCSFIQLNPALKKGKLFRIYSREEILAHEAIHVMRAGFSDSVYEELFAYIVSDSVFRKVFGPIFHTPGEAAFILFPIAFFPFLPFMTPMLSLVTMTVIFGSIGFFLFRLVKVRFRFFRLFRKLHRLFGSKKKAMEILIRLSGKEINVLSAMSPFKIKQYAKENRENFRWGYIYDHYFEKLDKNSPAVS